MAQIVIEMDGADFQRLTTNSTDWAKSWESVWAEQVEDGRFEHMGSDKKHDDAPRSTWKRAFWVEDDWSQVMICRAFLKSEGHDCEILWDMRDADQGEGQYVILTDYHGPATVDFEKRNLDAEDQFGVKRGDYVTHTGTDAPSGGFFFSGTGKVTTYSFVDPEVTQVVVWFDDPQDGRTSVVVPVSEVRVVQPGEK